MAWLLNSAIAAVEALPPSGAVGISAADLYSAAGRHSEVVAMTEGLENEDDASAFCWSCVAWALRELRHPDAAQERLSEALKSRGRAPEMRHRALIERAQAHLDAGRAGMARGDLERILAEDSDYPGLHEALSHLAGW